MFTLKPDLAVYLHRDAIDFRKSINGLAALVEHDLMLDAFAPAHSRCIADVHQLDLLRSHRWGRQEGLDDVMVVAPPRRKVQTATAAVVHSTLRTWQDWEAGVARMHPGLRGTVPTESRSGGSGVKSELKGCMP
jgi:hypothetical protein